MADHVNQAAYARSRRARDLPGKTRQSVERALSDGRIHLEDDGLIDPDRADREWTQNTDPARRSDANTRLADARADQAVVNARRARLELEEHEGKVARVDTIGRAWFELTRGTRDRLMKVGARVAGEIAAESDARVVERRINEEIREALASLTHGHTNGKGPEA